jgi:hypothetical protein
LPKAIFLIIILKIIIVKKRISFLMANYIRTIPLTGNKKKADIIHYNPEI